MASTAANDLEWSERVAKSVSEALLFPKLIGWKAFDPVLEIVTATIHGWLTQRDYPASQTDNKVDHAWTEKVARSIVAALVKAVLVTEDGFAARYRPRPRGNLDQSDARRSATATLIFALRRAPARNAGRRCLSQGLLTRYKVLGCRFLRCRFRIADQAGICER